MKTIAERLKSVNFDEKTPTPSSSGPRSPVAGHIGHVMADRRLHEENESLKARMAAFEGGAPVLLLDCTDVAETEWKNRLEAGFLDSDFEQLKSNIAAMGGNTVAIKVRPAAPGATAKYELVFGYRRLRACRELGLQVRAMVEGVDDRTLFIQMDSENRHRAALSAYEAGMWYARALEKKVFANAAALAEALGIDRSNVSRALAATRLPKDILAAFGDPRAIQYGWSEKVTEALNRDPESVLAVARAMAASASGKTPQQVYKALLEAVNSKGSTASVARNVGKPFQVKLHGRVAHVVHDQDAGVATVTLKGVGDDELVLLKAAVAELLDKFGAQAG